MRRFFAAVALAATLFAAAACTSDGDRADGAGGGTKVSLGVIPIVDVAPVYLGKQKGFFSSRGIDLTLVPEQGGALIIKGVLGAKYQFGFSNVTSLLAAQSDGAPLKAVANGVAPTGGGGGEVLRRCGQRSQHDSDGEGSCRQAGGGQHPEEPR